MGNTRKAGRKGGLTTIPDHHEFLNSKGQEMKTSTHILHRVPSELGSGTLETLDGLCPKISLHDNMLEEKKNS